MKERLRRDYGVPVEVHEQDYVFQHMLRAGADGYDRLLEVYIMASQADAKRLAGLIAASAPPSAPLRLLDFAAGYGRMARHFKMLLPEARLVAMDIHPAAVTFNRDILGIESVLSDHTPDRVPAVGPFEAIVAISFFSHLRREAFRPWLARLAEMLAPGGVLLFTAHGETSAAGPMSAVTPDETGYGHVAASDQDDISTRHYVSAVTLSRFVRDQIAALPGLRMIGFEPGTWMGHQDLYILQKVRSVEPG
jgi:SAM-dependent methyltransferase